MSDPLLRTLMLEELHKLVGQQVFFVYCGPSTGSVLDIHFYPTALRISPLPERVPGEYQRKHQGTRSLFIECGWALFKSQNRIMESDALSEDDYSIIQNLQRLTVSGVRFNSSETLDLSMSFGDTHHLWVQCDGVGPDDDDYCLYTTSIIFVVKSSGEIEQLHADGQI